MAAVLRRSLLAAALAAALSPALARAEELDKATRDSLQQIITEQLDAFAHEDAEKAESFASPGIRAKFPDPKDFAAMVHQSYAPLVRPRSTQFDKSGTSALGPMQGLRIIDKDGGSWTALYSFEQVDGQWRINGCVLVKEESTSV